MNIVKYKKFNASIAQKEAADQMYILSCDREWIKEQASTHRVRMVAVISALIHHAETSEEAFKRLLWLLHKQDEVLANGGILSSTITDEIQQVLKKYGV